MCKGPVLLEVCEQGEVGGGQMRQSLIGPGFHLVKALAKPHVFIFLGREVHSFH